MLVDPSVLISSLLGLLYLFAAVSFAHSDGVRYTPAEIRGWSTKYIARSNPTEELITSIATFLSTSQFAVAGYKYIIIDDGWTTCRSFVSGNQGTCAVAGERDDAGKLIADPNKFPRGLKALADFVHSKGLKLGLYAAISKTTCSGFTGSLGHEAVDAVTFADWGIDLVKHAACNPADCGINNGCLQNSTLIMANALKDSGREIVYYIDAGGKLPNRPRVYNPRSRSVPSAANGIGAAQNLVWTWAPERAHMWKNSPDMVDSFSSMLDNLRHQARIAEYQHCGSFNFPGELTVGLGNQTFKEYRSQFLLWSIQGRTVMHICRR